MIPITDSEFTQLAAHIHKHYGILLKGDKQGLVAGRLSPVLHELGLPSFKAYLQYLQQDRTGEPAYTLLEKITTNHTFFMREQPHFHFMRETALPYWKSQIRDRDLRIWSAGCSTGEEPYTIAMILHDFFALEKGGWDSQVLATDISRKVLETAERGVYPNESLKALPTPWRMRYFQSWDEEHSVVVDKIRRDCIFRMLNLVDPVFPFKRKFHLVFCRNVMIYFDSVTKRELILKFYDALEEGGYLFIGHSESIHREESPFKYVQPAIYRKG
ncbi:CheR family methyltransferase [Paenibacillus koleovorans]|uniref:CheR family methyltransferase n=1 Tax=Paenibacillus koleovorans TaxID=121608 RepID=UPI000FDC1982|nr:protein-glutamate O-methyltransferase CheR [Paenibacillus koleovorans]